jgi:hypothetical protein
MLCIKTRWRNVRQVKQRLKRRPLVLFARQVLRLFTPVSTKEEGERMELSADSTQRQG